MAKRAATVLLTVMIAFAAAILWMAGGIQSPHGYDEAPLDIGAGETSTSTTTITVVSWNIAWGYGWGSEGSGKARSKEHFEGSLPRVASAIKAANADIVLLQEIDFDATRSHRMDQLRMIGERTGLRYGAAAPSWVANWVPFPYWPPSEHFGAMSSGGAVLSRWPIASNHVELLEKPGANAWWYNLFYLFRYLQRCEIRAGERTLVVYNTHLEAFDGDNRMEQAEHLKRVIAPTPLTIFGGDFNTVPPESKVRGGYPDEPTSHHENDRTLETLRKIVGLRDSIPPEIFEKAEQDFMTFPSHAPNRKIDYIFYGEGFEVIEARVLKEAGEVSDHLPVLVRLRIRN
jgi:endonuclease/exonuclease/phosphatase family metal-dependent hydrolase